MITFAEPTVNLSDTPAQPAPAVEKEIQWTNRHGVKTPWYPLAELAERMHFFDIDWSVGWRTRVLGGQWVEKTR